MLRRKVIVLGFVALAIALAIAVDGARRERIHTGNMAKAELFKREFDAQVIVGARLTAVEDYLKTKPVTVTRSMGSRDRREFVKGVGLLLQTIHGILEV
jgi:hypothetical protein